MVMSLRSKWAAGKAVRAGLAVEGAYLNRYVTDEQRSRRPIFNATLRAAASWLFFRVARSTRMTQIWALRSRLEKQPTDLRRRHHYMRDGTLGHQVSAARSQPYYLDVTHPAANKGSVVDFLSAVYLIPASCIAAIGDMPNDILMFEKRQWVTPGICPRRN